MTSIHPPPYPQAVASVSQPSLLWCRQYFITMRLISVISISIYWAIPSKGCKLMSPPPFFPFILACAFFPLMCYPLYENNKNLRSICSYVNICTVTTIHMQLLKSCQISTRVYIFRSEYLGYDFHFIPKAPFISI